MCEQTIRAVLVGRGEYFADGAHNRGRHSNAAGLDAHKEEYRVVHDLERGYYAPLARREGKTPLLPCFGVHPYLELSEEALAVGLL